MSLNCSNYISYCIIAAQSSVTNGPETEPAEQFNNSSYTPSTTVTPAGSRDGLPLGK